MAGGFDYKNFKKMCNNVTKASKTIDQFLEDFLVGEALEALALTKERTPVDTGKLRAAWKLAKTERTLNSIKIFLVNDVAYASFMETGFTYEKQSQSVWREGYHMAELSLLEIANRLPAKLNKAFTSWLTGVVFS